MPRNDGDFNEIHDPSGRVESIPVRGSMQVRNVTENFSVGGEIRFLRYNGGLSLGHDIPASYNVSEDMGVVEYLDICDMIRDTKRSTSMDGHEVKATTQCNTYPADHVRAMTFAEDRTFSEAVRVPSYCSVLMLVEIL